MSKPRTAPPRKPFSHADLESAIVDAKDDMMLLDLACDMIQDRATKAARLAASEGERLEVLLSEDEFTILAHAMLRTRDAMRSVEAVFYGERQA